MKIVTLLPSATEIVAALDCLDAIVAVSHCCDYPVKVKQIPTITSSIIAKDLTPLQIDEAVVSALKSGQVLYQVDANMLESLQPDLIITQGVCDVCAVNSGTVQQSLRLLSDVVQKNATIVSLTGRDFAGIQQDIDKVANVIGMTDQAEQLKYELKQRWLTIDSKPKTGSRVAVLEWPDPMFYAGHWLPEMISVAGGVDVFGQIGVDSGRCTNEELIAANPEIIISAACGYGLEQNEAFARKFYQNKSWNQLSAIQNQQIWAIDANSYCSRPSPRLVKGADLLYQLFHQQSTEENALGFKRVYQPLN